MEVTATSVASQDTSLNTAMMEVIVVTITEVVTAVATETEDVLVQEVDRHTEEVVETEVEVAMMDALKSNAKVFALFANKKVTLKEIVLNPEVDQDMVEETMIALLVAIEIRDPHHPDAEVPQEDVILHHREEDTLEIDPHPDVKLVHQSTVTAEAEEKAEARATIADRSGAQAANNKLYSA